MSITVSQVQNVLRTYNRLLNAKSSGPRPDTTKGEQSPRGASSADRVTISEESRRKLAEIHPPTTEEGISDLEEGSSEEETVAQS